MSNTRRERSFIERNFHTILVTAFLVSLVLFLIFVAIPEMHKQSAIKRQGDEAKIEGQRILGEMLVEMKKLRMAVEKLG